jgi:hypothetical protein
MNLQLTIEPNDVLVVHLREGEEQTTVPVHPSRPGAESLLRAFDQAAAEGYGECFWPGLPTGQSWWIFKRDDETMEVVAMWTRGGASSWQHVFRATDSVAWVRERLISEIDRLGLRATG